jgi:4-amino-4-deoxy-L-arabinose transferase-like glycosyltransferase
MQMRDRSWLVLLVPILVFLAWHVPLMFRTAAGQDEDWYGVTGIAILRTGLPHVPYITSDDPRSVCYQADEALYTLPPLNFYLQALVHLLLGKGLGQARLVSTLAGLGAVFLVHALGRLWLDDRRGALLGSMVYLFSRPFLFPATMARPDMTAVAFGLLAIWFAARYGRDPRRRLLTASGAAAGLCLLTHPFGVVPATQASLGMLIRPGPITRRIQDALVFSTTALGVFCLWLPLIALHPDLFQVQFGGNVLLRAGPGLKQTLGSLLPTLAFQMRQLWGLLMPIQTVLFLLGLGWCLFGTRATSGGREFRYHAWASLLLLVLFQGRHPTLGYFAYPAAFASLAVGMLASTTAAWLERRSPKVSAAASGTMLVLLVTALLPGAGLRTLISYLRHWNLPAYNAHSLTHLIMADVPTDAVTAVDSAYVLEFYLAGRPVIDAFIEPSHQMHLYDVRDKTFDYVVFGPRGLRLYRPRMNDLVLLKTYGDPHDDSALSAELFRRLPSGPRSGGG